MLIGLKGSKSMLTFFSLPSSVTMVPQYTTKPLGGTVKEKIVWGFSNTRISNGEKKNNDRVLKEKIKQCLYYPTGKVL